MLRPSSAHYKYVLESNKKQIRNKLELHSFHPSFLPLFFPTSIPHYLCPSLRLSPTPQSSLPNTSFHPSLTHSLTPTTISHPGNSQSLCLWSHYWSSVGLRRRGHSCGTCIRRYVRTVLTARLRIMVGVGRES